MKATLKNAKIVDGRLKLHIDVDAPGAIDNKVVVLFKHKITTKQEDRNVKVFCPTGPGGGVDPTCSPNQRTVAKYKIFIDPHFKSLVDDVLKQHFGGISYEALAELTGAPAESSISIKATPSHGTAGSLRITMAVDNAELGLSAYRNIFVKDGKKTIHNDGFVIDEAHRGHGIGTQMFKQQVDAAIKLGVDQIQCTAEKSKYANGSYTWARLGFDGALPSYTIEKLGRDKDAPDWLKGSKTIHELMTKPGGREWWIANNESFEARFDLKEGSLSRRILNAYIEEKRRAASRKSANLDGRGRSDLRQGLGRDHRKAKAFCPTGEGGGIDNSCSPSGGVAVAERSKTNIAWKEYVDPEDFVNARNKSTRPQYLSPVNPDDLENHELILSEDGTVGAAVSPDGDIQNVFNNGGPKGAATEAILEAMHRGGVMLDCYDGFLPAMYSQFGFTESGRMKFNRDYAPPNWDFENDDDPDVVFMSRTRLGKDDDTRKRIQTKPWPAHVESDKYYENWDEAKADSRAAARTGSSSRDKGLGVGKRTRKFDSQSGRNDGGIIMNPVVKSAVVKDGVLRIHIDLQDEKHLPGRHSQVTHGRRGGAGFKAPKETEEKLVKYEEKFGEFKGQPNRFAKDAAGKRNGTLYEYTDENGNWTPERQALHKQIIDSHFENASPVPVDQQPIATFLGGGSASGKTTMLKAGGVDIPANVVHVDPDEIKHMLPEYASLVRQGNPGASSHTHEESSYLAKQIHARAIKEHYNTVLDGTGDSSLENLTAKVMRAKEAGHKTVARYATIDTDTAVKISMARAKKTGRAVPEAAIREIHKNVSAVVPQAISAGIYDDFRLYDNNIRNEARLAASANGSNLNVHEQQLWDNFLAKAQSKRG